MIKPHTPNGEHDKEWPATVPTEAEVAWWARPDAMLLSALSYVRTGLAVLPLTPGSKVPLSGRLGCCGGTHRHGCLDASTDEALVNTWWWAHPRANVGIATGDWFDVVDLDGPEGAASWASVASADDLAAVRGVVLTPRGRHLYRPATGRGNGTAILPGIDYRGVGGFAVVPPSVVGGVRYRFARSLDVTR